MQMNLLAVVVRLVCSPSVCLSGCLSVCPSVCLSVCLSAASRARTLQKNHCSNCTCQWQKHAQRAVELHAACTKRAMRLTFNSAGPEKPGSRSASQQGEQLSDVAQSHSSLTGIWTEFSDEFSDEVDREGPNFSNVASRAQLCYQEDVTKSEGSSLVACANDSRDQTKCGLSAANK